MNLTKLLRSRGLINSVANNTMLSAKSKPKYSNTKVKIGDITYDSKAEARQAKILNDSGLVLITNGKKKIRLTLVPKQKFGNISVRSVDYVPDFVVEANGSRYYIDTKGFRTPDYIIKYKIMLQNNTPILESKNLKQLATIITMIRSGNPPLVIWGTLQ